MDKIMFGRFVIAVYGLIVAGIGASLIPEQNDLQKEKINRREKMAGLIILIFGTLLVPSGWLFIGRIEDVTVMKTIFLPILMGVGLLGSFLGAAGYYPTYRKGKKIKEFWLVVLGLMPIAGFMFGFIAFMMENGKQSLLMIIVGVLLIFIGGCLMYRRPMKVDEEARGNSYKINLIILLAGFLLAWLGIIPYFFLQL